MDLTRIANQKCEISKKKYILTVTSVLSWYLLPAILFFTSSPIHSQTFQISSQTRRIIAGIQKNNTYETAIYPDKTGSKQIERYDLLKKTASEEELKQLTKHKNGVVKVYSFQALSERHYEGLYAIILHHLGDDEGVDCYFHGFDFIHSENYKSTVAAFFVSSKALTPRERISLDSILLFSDHHLGYTDQLLREIAPEEKYYAQIRKLAEKNEYEGAIIALSKFKRQCDLGLIEKGIKKSPYYSLNAIEIFPDPYFKDILTGLRNEEIKPYGIYPAVAVYQDSFAYNFLYQSMQEPVKEEYFRHEKAKAICNAMQKYRCPVYNELFFQLWQNADLINDSLLAYLQEVDRPRSIQLAMQSLKEPGRIDNRTLVIEDLLNLLVEFDSTKARIIINYNIDKADVHTFRFFAEKAQAFQDMDIVNAMFGRLEQTDNPYIYIPAVRTILSYHNDQLNERLLAGIKDNEKITGWGLEEVIHLLDSNGLKL